MNIFLFGASGATGKEVLNKLLSKNFQVKALVRNPEKLNFSSSSNLTIIKGDVLHPDTFRHELKNCDAVISTLGTGSSRKPTTIYSAGGKNIITAMKMNGIKKLIVLTAAAFDLSDPNNHSFLVKFIVRPLFKNIYADMILLEKELENNLDIDWVCIRPTRLVSKSSNQQYRININHSPEGGSKISRTDLADFIVKEITDSQYIHRKPVIAY